MQLYNTFSKQLEEFVPISKKNVTIYTCGPTVYRDVHIGNLRTYLTTDILRRVLKANEYEVNSVMNITDVGHFRFSTDVNKVIDPIVEEAQKMGLTPLELSKIYTDKFLKDAKKFIQERQIAHFKRADADYGARIEQEIAKLKPQL